MSTTAPHANMLRLLLGALGATSACGASLIAPGCGAKVTVDGSSTTSTTTTGGGGAGGQATSSTSSISSSSGMPLDCKAHLVSTAMQAPPGTCGFDAGFFSLNYNCFSAPAAPATCAGAYTDACILSTYSCGLTQGGMSIACGPVNEIQGLCCYVIDGDCAVGRPFTVGGRARLGALVPGEGWRALLAPELSGLDAATRAALADAWGQEALFEHASIASFARFVMQLLALGAPAELVLSAQRALVEEHGHARACLGLASAYAGLALQPAALPIEGALDESGALAIVESLAREGCVAETVAALQARHACDEARDPVVKAALDGIAREETEHAALAWRALAWALERGDAAMRAAVRRVFADAEAHVSLGAITRLAGDEAAMRAHGYLPIEERRALAREALGRVIGPAATALLGARPDQRAPEASTASMVSFR